MKIFFKGQYRSVVKLVAETVKNYCITVEKLMKVISLAGKLATAGVDPEKILRDKLYICPDYLLQDKLTDGNRSTMAWLKEMAKEVLSKDEINMEAVKGIAEECRRIRKPFEEWFFKAAHIEGISFNFLEHKNPLYELTFHLKNTSLSDLGLLVYFPMLVSFDIIEKDRS